MSDPETQAPGPETASDPEESFGELFAAYEKAHSRKRSEDGTKQLEGTVISVNAESVYLDIGFKSEGVLPLSAFGGEAPTPGAKVPVSVKGRNE